MSYSISPKSNEDQQKRHRNMYKTSPNWQQIYKKQCLSRLNDRRNESRSRLIERFRNINLNSNEEVFDSHSIVDEVMQSVWKQFNDELPPIDRSHISDFMEQIRQELIIEESRYWEELMERRNQEELEYLVSLNDH